MISFFRETGALWFDFPVGSLWAMLSSLEGTDSDGLILLLYLLLWMSNDLIPEREVRFHCSISCFVTAKVSYLRCGGLILLSYLWLWRSNYLLPERDRCRRFAIISFLRETGVAMISYLKGTGAGGLQWSPPWEGQVQEICNELLLRDRCRRFAMISYLRGTGAGGLQWSPTWKGQVQEVCNDLLPERDRCRRFAMIYNLRGREAGGFQWSPTWEG
jgi:hypothetical protein